MARSIFALIFALQIASILTAQQPAKAAATKTTAANDIFSGTVTASVADSVTVVRKVPARPDEYRQFVVDKDTKIEGKLRLNARVSVRFKADDDGVQHALRVIVRAADGKPDVKTNVKTTAGAGRSGANR